MSNALIETALSYQRAGRLDDAERLYREVLRDVFDLPALLDILRQIRSRAIRVEPAVTETASPFARSLACQSAQPAAACVNIPSPQPNSAGTRPITTARLAASTAQ